MSFKLTTFGGATLPPYEPDVSLDLGEAQDSIFGVPGGGIFDALGTEQYRRQGWALSYSGQYVHTSAVQLKASLDALNREYGKTQKLYRRQSDGSSQWVNARLMNVTGRRSPRNVNNQVVTCAFKVASPYWHGVYRTRTSHIEVMDGKSLNRINMYCTNAGNVTISDPVVSVEAVGSSIIGVRIQIFPAHGGSTAEGHLHVGGTITAGNTVVLDCGKRTVRNNNTQSYANFGFLGYHSYDDWIRIEPSTAGISGTSSTRIYFTCTGGLSTMHVLSVSWYEGWI